MTTSVFILLRFSCLVPVVAEQCEHSRGDVWMRSK